MARTSRERCEHIETLFVPVDDGTAIAPQLLCDGECRALCAIVVMSVPSVIEAAVSSPVGPSSTNSHESMTISNAQHHLPLAAYPLLYHLPLCLFFSLLETVSGSTSVKRGQLRTHLGMRGGSSVLPRPPPLRRRDA